ncbi:endonuclease/exonuclease/phosphatase family protein [Aliifodinibius sp. S!AR15-10]|uniref:endonuclease/exonuclease/phosphatase family protein n=1 Tax=Aliifodinibius sp. S!AR15-10 TaxID=2950437 RepID=UPI0028631CF5|nr:endonuclease/exonuclease/phosphatase family protein [Aliifodinibius sp. S!AR15-10]MDR8394592.1 endonuclease/exonuclease/phosphatase family protein [Aliifodinibius sp. S!AR15-10]
MTYNIRYDGSVYDAPQLTANHWENRKDVQIGLLNFHHPDVVGLQEALQHQVEYFADNLPGYKWVGVGREDGEQEGEYNPIFYNSKRFTLVKYDTFWLSNTPQKPSKSWDAGYTRICTWGLLEDKQNGTKFFLFNTHFDSKGRVARLESAKLLKEKIKEIAGGTAVIVTGDFNFIPNSKAYKEITSGKLLRDSKKASRYPPYGPEGTFSGFDYNAQLKSRIDYIFVNTKVNVQKYGVLTDSYNQKYPSDHLPVMIEVEISE